jgi:hypothetical protein
MSTHSRFGAWAAAAVAVATLTACAAPTGTSGVAAPSSAASGPQASTSGGSAGDLGTTATASRAASSAPAAGPVGGPVPSGFTAWSVTFVSDEEAYILGDAPCATPPCTSMVRTLDGGRTWRGMPAPRAPLPTRSGDVSTAPGTVRDVRFGSPRDGWAFGGALWSTHDGAASWRRVAVGGRVLDLASDGQSGYAVVADCAASGACRVQLLATPVSADTFRPVTGVSPSPAGAAIGSVSTGAGLVVAVLGSGVFVRHGTQWTPATRPCLDPTASVVAPASGSTLTAYCPEGAAGSVYLTVRQSSDFGRHWATVNGPALRLANGPLSVTAGSTSVLAAATTNPDTKGGISVSRDGGRTWVPPSLPRTAAGWRYVGARSASALVALQEPPAPVLWATGDAGRSWTAYRIR